MSNKEKFVGTYYRDRAQLLSELRSKGIKPYELAIRFKLSEGRVYNIIHAWRKRGQP